MKTYEVKFYEYENHERIEDRIRFITVQLDKTKIFLYKLKNGLSFAYISKDGKTLMKDYSVLTDSEIFQESLVTDFPEDLYVVREALRHCKDKILDPKLHNGTSWYKTFQYCEDSV